jgi:hypothetical protein
LLQAGGYASFKAWAGKQKEGAVQFAFCWAHARRKLFEFHYATRSLITAGALRRIAVLYAIEARTRGRI